MGVTAAKGARHSAKTQGAGAASHTPTSPTPAHEERRSAYRLSPYLVDEFTFTRAEVEAARRAAESPQGAPQGMGRSGIPASHGRQRRRG